MGDIVSKKSEKNQNDDFNLEEDMLGQNSKIALKLRQFYSTIQDEAIPDKFLDLLEKLDQAEQSSSK